MSTYQPAYSPSNFNLLGPASNLVDLQKIPSPKKPRKPTEVLSMTKKEAMARAIRIFLALDLLPEMDFFVSPNIYDAQLSCPFRGIVGLGGKG